MRFYFAIGILFFQIHFPLLIIDAQVTEEWIARYDGPANFSDLGIDLALDLYGNVYVTGHSVGIGTGLDYATIKYGNNGNQLWVARYSGPGDGWDFPFAISTDSYGNAYVTGAVALSSTQSACVTIKYDSSGDTVWVAQYSTGDNRGNAGRDIAVDRTGNVFVTGASETTGTGSDYFTVKYDSSGNQIWVDRYNGTGNGGDAAYFLAIDDSGNVYASGTSVGSDGYYEGVAIKYDRNGNRRWVVHYNGPANLDNGFNEIAVDNFGNVYVVGGSYTSPVTRDGLTFKYDSNGTELWIARYSGPDSASGFSFVALDEMGNVYVTGSSRNNNYDHDYATIKYDSSGNELWVTRYNGLGNFDDVPYDLALDRFGNIYVTGRGFNSNNDHEYTTIKYDNIGNEVWVALYNGPGDFDIA